MSNTVLQFLKRGKTTSKQIQIFTGRSQAVVSRRLKNLGEQVIKSDYQRPPVYLLTKEAFGAGNKLTIVMTNATGKNDILTLRHNTAIQDDKKFSYQIILLQGWSPHLKII